jgi:uncharacterized protein DUF3108
MAVSLTRTPLAQDTATVTPPAASQVAPPADSLVRPWHVGEYLEYNVKFGMFSVGRATMRVLDIDTVRGEPVYHVVFTIHGHALMYTLNDSLQSWFGVHDLVSRRFQQDTDERGHMRHRSYEIFPERRQWVRNGTDTSETVADPLDDASFFFFARTTPFEDGQTYTYARYFIPDRNPVSIKVLQRQTISVPAGRFATVAVRPIIKSGGLFGQGGQAIIWFSDDAAHIPVRIRSSLLVGTIEMSLRERR